jgi:hypothetical protein
LLFIDVQYILIYCYKTGWPQSKKIVVRSFQRIEVIRKAFTKYRIFWQTFKGSRLLWRTVKWLLRILNHMLSCIIVSTQNFFEPHNGITLDGFIFAIIWHEAAKYIWNYVKMNSQLIIHIQILRKRAIYKRVRGPVVCYMKLYCLIVLSGHVMQKGPMSQKSQRKRPHTGVV